MKKEEIGKNANAESSASTITTYKYMCVNNRDTNTDAEEMREYFVSIHWICHAYLNNLLETFALSPRVRVSKHEDELE